MRPCQKALKNGNHNESKNGYSARHFDDTKQAHPVYVLRFRVIVCCCLSIAPPAISQKVCCTGKAEEDGSAPIGHETDERS